MQCKRSVVTLPDKVIFLGGREVSAKAKLPGTAEGEGLVGL